MKSFHSFSLFLNFQYLQHVPLNFTMSCFIEFPWKDQANNIENNDKHPFYRVTVSVHVEMQCRSFVLLIGYRLGSRANSE